MAAQSFFFTGYAIVATSTLQPRNPLLAKQLDLLFDIIPAVACISDILIYCSVIAGVLALYRLRRAYATHVAPVGNFPEIDQGSGLIRWSGSCLSDSAADADRLVNRLESRTSLIGDPCGPSLAMIQGGCRYYGWPRA